ncbi:protein phosphatase 1F-like isoform X1 [Solea solea]|uniref:protein phosphatase 1F-like isoform X1 n=2 Tax=Solea solea TaxID=90069 RepID=UPI00272B0A70|nr:protein phosphatase 1F-like isoform X1 [Solea solea]
MAHCLVCPLYIVGMTVLRHSKAACLAIYLSRFYRTAQPGALRSLLIPMDEETRSFLRRFLDEFPTALEEDRSLPITPLSCKITLEEMYGESLALGLSLLAERGAPAVFSALLCQAALSHLLQADLSLFYCPQKEEPKVSFFGRLLCCTCCLQKPEADQEEEEQTQVLLHSEAVQRFFLNKLIDVALAWHQNSFLPPSMVPQFRLCSVQFIKNRRTEMEDMHLALAEFNQLFGIRDGVDRAYYAVFDGHGGVHAANYCVTHLHVALSKQETLQSDAAAAFKAALRHTDYMFRGKAERESLIDGTTAVAVLIHGQELTVAWLGDSQAVLVRNGQAEKLTEPHKPETEEERQRIEDIGGYITYSDCWRVKGILATSRAIGDFDLKPYVSGDADCLTMRLSGDEDYILLASDGFSDVVKPSLVPNLVLEALQQPDDPEGGEDSLLQQSEENIGFKVTDHLVRAALKAGSTDNITVMVVFLRPLDQLLWQTSQATEEDSTSQDAPQQ